MKTEPKDVFLHLLAMVTLYASAISFITLTFQIINYYIPDQLNDPYYRDSIVGTMRWAIAMLVVLFPTYLLAMRALNQGYAAEPGKRSLGIRKWLVYFTLFVAALIVLGNMVALIFNFLEGELTLRFFLKILTMVFVTGSIFYYYFTDIRVKELKAS